MKRIFGFLTVAAFAGMLFAANALAASSGNFSATVDNMQCQINSATGKFNGTASTLTSAGSVWEIGANDITVQIANGSGTTLIVTPSLITGLFTDNKISSTTSSSTQDVGIQVQLNVISTAPGFDTSLIHIAPNTNGAVGGPNVCSLSTNNGTLCAANSACISGSTCTAGFCTGGTNPGGLCSTTADCTGVCSAENTGASCDTPVNGKASCVIYDQRFIQISSAVLASLAGCTAIATTTSPTCFEFIESTLSAHSFNFYVQAPGGTYNFDVDAQLFVGNNNTAGAGSIAGCSGPGTVTVQQVKNFSFDSTITF